MSLLVLFSLIVKCLGAVLEIGSQAIISQLWSVETYGTYAFFIALADGFYALLFSGIIKFNNFYIPQGKNTKQFRKRYYLFYALPLVILSLIISFAIKNTTAICAIVAGFAYLCAMDSSSQMMSYGRYRPALVGEYCIGRSFVILAILVVSIGDNKQECVLYIIYGLQFCVALVYYVIVNRRRTIPQCDGIVEKGMVKKYVVFQSTEIAHTIIIQTSVIVQFIFGGAFQTAIISIVLVVRKLINFISGPTSKLYQPEFSKRFVSGDQKGLADVYAQITRIQTCFMMPVFTLLISRPEVVLQVYNAELIRYGWLVRATGFVFLTMIAFGPLSNFLPMTGHEKIDTIINWSSVAVMYAMMLCFKDNQYFVVLGFCAQILYVNVFKLALFIKYMRCLPMPIADYFKIAIIWATSSLAVYMLPNSVVLTLFICVFHFVANFIFVFPKDDLVALLNRVKNKKKVK